MVEFRKTWSEEHVNKLEETQTKSEQNSPVPELSQDRPVLTHSSPLAPTIDYISENTRAKAEGHIQILSTLTRLGSIALFWHPTRTNIFYKRNVSVCHRKHRITSKSKSGDKVHLRSKALSAFSPGASLTVPQSTVHHKSCFWPCSDGGQPQVPFFTSLWRQVSFTHSAGTH